MTSCRTIEQRAESFASLGQTLRAQTEFKDDNQARLKRYLELAELLYASIDDAVIQSLRIDPDGGYTLDDRRNEELLTPAKLLAEIRATLTTVLSWNTLPAAEAETVINSLDYWELRQQVRISNDMRRSIEALVEGAAHQAIQAHVPDMVQQGTETALHEARRWRRSSVHIASILMIAAALLVGIMGGTFHWASNSLDQINAESKNASAERVELKGSTQILGAKAERLNQRLHELDRRRQHLQVALDTDTRKLENKVNDFNEQITQAARRNDVNRIVTNIDTTLTKLTADLNTAAENISALSTQMESKIGENALQPLHARIDALNSMIADNKNVLNRISTEYRRMNDVYSKEEIDRKFNSLDERLQNILNILGDQTAPQPDQARPDADPPGPDQAATMGP